MADRKDSIGGWVNTGDIYVGFDVGEDVGVKVTI